MPFPFWPNTFSFGTGLATAMKMLHVGLKPKAYVLFQQISLALFYQFYINTIH